MQHLRSKSEVPMSVSNYDRNGIENLTHEPVKPLDRMKIPPWAIYTIVFCIFGLLGTRSWFDEELDAEKMMRRNMLLAMKRTQSEKVSGQKETSLGEKHEMKSYQYKSVVKDQTENEKKSIDNIKRSLLSNNS